MMLLLIVDTGDRLFTEDDLGMVLGTFFVEDIDSVNLSQATIELSNKQENDKLIASDEFWNTPDESVEGKITLTSKVRGEGESSTITTFNQALSAVKFDNISDSPNTDIQRIIKINVTDLDASGVQNKSNVSPLTFKINVEGKNDDSLLFQQAMMMIKRLILLI